MKPRNGVQSVKSGALRRATTPRPLGSSKSGIRLSFLFAHDLLQEPRRALVGDQLLAADLDVLWFGRRQRPAHLAMQIPQDAADDQTGAREHEYVERFAVEPPADDRDQRNAQEIERDHHAGVAGAKRVAQ